MRIINLFLVLNVLICYGGICANAGTLDNNESEMVSSCHEVQVHHPQKRDSIDSSPLYTLSTVQLTKNCCQTAAINSFSNDNSDNFATLNLLDGYLFPNLITDGHKKTILISNIRYHDPPLIFISNSSFLI